MVYPENIKGYRIYYQKTIIEGLASSSSKSRHIKTCKAKKQQLIEEALIEVVPKKKRKYRNY